MNNQMMLIHQPGFRWFFAQFQWPLLLLAGVGLLFPSPQRVWLILAVPMLIIANLLGWQKPFPKTPLNPALLLLLVMVAVSAWASYDLAISLPKIAGVLLGCCLFMVIAQHGQSNNTWFMILLAYALCSMAIAGLGLLGTKWGSAKFTELNAFTLWFPSRLRDLPGAKDGFNPNEVAGALLWCIPMLLAEFLAPLRSKVPFRSLWLSILVTLSFGAAVLWCGATLILTQSRGAYLALTVTLLLMALLALPSYGRKLALFGSAVGVATVWIFQPAYFSTLVGFILAKSNASSSASAIHSLSQRFEIWSSAVYAIRDFPLTGMGMNTFRYAAYMLYPLFTGSPDGSLGHAHNEFLQAALDLGIPGLVAFISIYLISFWMLVCLFQKAERCETHGLPLKALVLGLGGSLFAHFIFGLADTVSLGAKPGFMFWILLGMITSLFLQFEAHPKVAKESTSEDGNAA